MGELLVFQNCMGLPLPRRLGMLQVNPIPFLNFVLLVAQFAQSYAISAFILGFFQ
jgi:hypothetical protein